MRGLRGLGIQGLANPVFSAGCPGEEYYLHIKRLLSTNLVLYLPLWEASGTTAADISANAYNGTVIAPTWGQEGIGDGRTSLLFVPASATRIGSFPAGLLAGFPGGSGTFSVWLKVPAAAWTDAAVRQILQATAGTHYIWIRKSSTSNQLAAAHVSTAIKTWTIACSLTDWFNLTVTWEDGGSLIGYINGEPLGTAAGVGTFAGALTLLQVGSPSAGGSSPWSGNMQHVVVGSRALSPAEVGELVSPFQ